jgi:dihydroorotase/N-acyl-D-amino-acid deacylase
MHTPRLNALLAVFCAAAAAASAVPLAQAPGYDLLLRNARIVDGSGSPWYRGDVAVNGDTIARVAPSIEGTAKTTIDVKGQILSPGFIDIHTHSSRGIFDIPTADNYVRQGVTTVIEGPDGGSPVPLGPFLAKLETLKRSVNIGAFIGQGSIRSAAVGEVNRPASAEEVDQMRSLVEAGMRDGALGLSTGLFYVPGAFTTTDEVVELAKVAGRFGGIHISHMRDETSRVLDSVSETIAIGERGGLPTQITHHKIIGRPNWGRSIETLAAVDQARARGVDVTIDAYPYTASSTSIQGALIPTWAQDGGRKQLLARLADRDVRQKIRAETVRVINNERGGGDPRNIVLASCNWDESLAGKNLTDVTRGRGLEPSVENAAESALWIVERGGCQAVFHAIGEDDLERILKHPATMIGSDGEIPTFGKGSPHPRSYGTFVRVLGVYVRDRKTITLQDAIRKMTSFPAARLALADRGLVRPGMKADLVVFDPDTVRDVATFDKPHQYAAGILQVITNGQVVFDGSAMTAARPGIVVYGPGRVQPRP